MESFKKWLEEAMSKPKQKFVAVVSHPQTGQENAEKVHLLPHDTDPAEEIKKLKQHWRGHGYDVHHIYHHGTVHNNEMYG